MKQGPFLAVAGAILVVAVSAGLGTLPAQQPPPAENKGVTTKPHGVIALGPEIEGMAGRQLRSRWTTVAPGGTIGNHSHKDRPAIEYVLEGKFTEYRNGVMRELGPGDYVVADKDTTHAWENKGITPVVLLPVDIFKP